MKRVFAITILVLTMASLMVGCGETHQEQSSTDLASKEDNLPLVEEEKDDISSAEPDLETVALLGKQNGKPLPDENIKELAAYLGSGNAKPDDTIEIRVDADKVYEILDREKEAKESK